MTGDLLHIINTFIYNEWGIVVFLYIHMNVIELFMTYVKYFLCRKHPIYPGINIIFTNSSLRINTTEVSTNVVQ